MYSPDFNLRVARFYLNELREAVKRPRGAHLERTLSAYGPIFGFSTSQFVKNLVTEKTKATLLARFVLRDHLKAIDDNKAIHSTRLLSEIPLSLELQELTVSISSVLRSCHRKCEGERRAWKAISSGSMRFPCI